MVLVFLNHLARYFAKKLFALPGTELAVCQQKTPGLPGV
jgi:hypothetical protein